MIVLFLTIYRNTTVNILYFVWRWISPFYLLED